MLERYIIYPLSLTNIEMEAGSQHILKYSAIEDLVREGAVRLI